MAALFAGPSSLHGGVIVFAFNVLLVCLSLPSSALAEKRVALVIGNSDYQHTPRLANPKNDATEMAAALTKLGFEVLEGFNLDKPSFDRKVRDFPTALGSAEAGVFFYRSRPSGSGAELPCSDRGRAIDRFGARLRNGKA